MPKFVNRNAELATLAATIAAEGVAADGEEPATVAFTVITGTAGVGKTNPECRYIFA